MTDSMKVEDPRSFQWGPLHIECNVGEFYTIRVTSSSCEALFVAKSPYSVRLLVDNRDVPLSRRHIPDPRSSWEINVGGEAV